MSNIIELTQAILKITPQRWTNLIEALPNDLLKRQPKAGEWSAAEVLQHMIDVEVGVFRFRVECFLEGKERFPAFDPDGEGSQGGEPDLKDLAAEFARLRAETMPVLARITPTDLGRTAIHGELGEVSLENMLNEWSGHDLMHLVQAERALMQPFIPASGPWRSYFADHEA